MDCFHYPLDTETLLRKKRKLRRELLARNPHPLHKKIAILGGSTTNEVADQLGLFLLQYGIEAEFYQSEYAQYWQDAMFGTPELDDFHPDVIYIHTNWRNLTALPTARLPSTRCSTSSTPILRRCGRLWSKNSPARSSRTTLTARTSASWATATSGTPMAAPTSSAA